MEITIISLSVIFSTKPFCERRWQLLMLQMGLFLITWNLDRVQHPPASQPSLTPAGSAPILLLKCSVQPLSLRGRSNQGGLAPVCAFVISEGDTGLWDDLKMFTQIFLLSEV